MTLGGGSGGKEAAFLAKASNCSSETAPFKDIRRDSEVGREPLCFSFSSSVSSRWTPKEADEAVLALLRDISVEAKETLALRASLELSRAEMRSISVTPSLGALGAS